MGALTLVLGGQKSGKSTAAMALARASGRPVLLLTPALGDDPELAERIERHRQDRADDVTVEETFALASSLRQHDQPAAVVDALDTWLLERMQVHGLLEVGDDPVALGPDGRRAQELVLAEVDELAAAARARSGPTWIVAGMVGMGVHGATPASRRFEDLHGLVTQRLGRSGRVLLLVAGHAIDVSALDVLTES